MTDNTEQLPEEPVGDLEPAQVTDADAAAIRGGAESLRGESYTLGSLVSATNEAVRNLGNALSQAANK